MNTELSNTSNKEDKVNHPSHYTWLKKLCGIEVIDITRHMNFNLGNVVKYVLRAGHKSEEGYLDEDKEIEDLRKAKWYLEDELKLRSKDSIEKLPTDSATVNQLIIHPTEYEKLEAIISTKLVGVTKITLTQESSELGGYVTSALVAYEGGRVESYDITNYSLW